MTDRLRARMYARYAETCSGTALDAARTPYLRHLIRRHFPANQQARFIDIGCGDGALLDVAATEGYRNGCGVDHSAQQVELARRRGLVKVYESDGIGALANLESGATDLVVTMDVLEHLTSDDLLSMVDAVHRALAPGGRWIIHVPNGESPFFGRIRYGDMTHIQAFTRSSLKQLLLSSGFSRVECFEDKPIVHGARSAARYVVWAGLRSALRLYLAAETGSTDPDSIFSQNLLAIAFR